ncbi:helix-turn-helix domain-containing protein [Leifsonia shinshuensis]
MTAHFREHRVDRRIDHGPQMRDNDPMTRPALVEIEDDPISDAAVAALGFSEIRARILQIAFREGGCTADSLVEQLGISRSGVTFHIKPLVDAGLLTEEIDRRAARGGSNRKKWTVNESAFDDAVETFRRSVRSGK